METAGSPFALLFPPPSPDVGVVAGASSRGGGVVVLFPRVKARETGKQLLDPDGRPAFGQLLLMLQKVLPSILNPPPFFFFKGKITRRVGGIQALLCPLRKPLSPLSPQSFLSLSLPLPIIRL